MPVIKAYLQEQWHEIQYSEGKSLKDILNGAGNIVASGCKGNGACGLCRVRIEKHSLERWSSTEQIHLSEDERNAGVHLSCQVFPKTDLTLSILNPARKSEWHPLPHPDYVCTYPIQNQEQSSLNTFIGAVDLGTTTISMALCRMDGKLISACEGQNPQSRIGSDVITRLICATRTPKDAKQLQNWVISAITAAQYTCELNTPIPDRMLQKIFVVGNSAMLALLNGKGADSLLNPDSWDSCMQVCSETHDEWCHVCGLPGGPSIELIPPIGGFIGSDLLAGIIYTHLLDGQGTSLFIDFGTNTEIALWDGTTLWVTSTAGGPAFEGEGITCGMAADPGAVYRITTDPSSHLWNVDTICGNSIQGICGSGLVDAVALLLISGNIDSLGRIISDVSSSGIKLPIPGTSLYINKKDIGVLQQAKAAIGAGVEILCQMASLDPSHLNQVIVGGAFGKSLHIENSIAIGLLPSISPDRIKLLENTALSGCLDLALSNQARMMCKSIRRSIKLVNLAHSKLFEEYFFQNLYLCPMGSSSGIQNL
ncbi:MAG TPA: ASKHA domain-containing protein [Methanospirillum sp.]|uniref:ASKHA domain-containing protein n=1 Tax=Methanospirillum sp. TaxID=45200 RepID=UPI002C929D22|nr:ASKHA domain-containing protein [Methanospirillum sp.]HWQ64798.1 ASKHA domain-containing protein [Methanospirillum sp.]